MKRRSACVRLPKTPVKRGFRSVKVSSRILVSLLAGEESRLRARLDWLQGRVGKVELRLDHLPDDVDLAQLRKDYPKLEWYAACRIHPENESRSERLLRAAAAGFDGIDFPVEDGVAPEVPQGVRRIHSWHQESADGADLRAVLQDLQARVSGQDLMKLVAWADFAEEAWPVLDLYSEAPATSMLAFAQGMGGGASRLLALRCGAPWIYSSWPGDATAPGQWNVVELLRLLPEILDAKTPALGVLGHPVLHSLSPLLWQSAMQEKSGQPSALYTPYPVQSLQLFLEGAAKHGMTAFSVTAPHKQAAFQIAAPLEGALGEAASACEAANLLVRKNGTWFCGNSDGVGAMDALGVENAAPENPKHLLILGSGGASSAVQVEAQRRGWQVTATERKDLETIQPSAFDAIAQATPVGSVAQPGMLTPGRPPSPQTPSLDMVYHPLQTEWLRQAHAAGAQAIPGTQMLLHQMIAQYGAVFPHAGRPDSIALQQALQQHLNERTPLVLLGARASGKSTLGRALAEALQWNFQDADQVLEQQSKRSIADWIAHDEEGFRDLEADILSQLLSQPFTVVATGGGVVERTTSVAQLEVHSRVVWLQCNLEELLRRQKSQPRPKLTDLDLADEIKTLLERRSPAYEKASSCVVSTNEILASAVMKVLLHFELKGFVQGFR